MECIWLLTSANVTESSMSKLCFDVNSPMISSFELLSDEKSDEDFWSKIAHSQSMDQLWVMFAACLVFVMQNGFTMLEAGAVKNINVQNILFKNLMDAFLGTVVWFCYGFTMAFGIPKDSNKFIGSGNAALHEEKDWNFFFFQWTFAVTAATIVSGSVAGRCSLLAYILYTLFLTSWVYPIVAHWIWSDDGWLSAFNDNISKNSHIDGGVIDFAGSCVAHTVGGWSGLMGAVFLGPRIGRFSENNENNETATNHTAHKTDRNLSKNETETVSLKNTQNMAQNNEKNENFHKNSSLRNSLKNLEHEHTFGNNVVYQVLGLFFLWFGWYGFNCGSTLAAAGVMEVAGRVAVNTTFAGAAGGFSCLMMNLLIDGYWSVPSVVNGVLAGFVSITASCSVVSNESAWQIGLLGAVFYFSGSRLLVALKVDDPLDAWAVHGVCGVWGTLGTALFAESEYIASSGYNDHLIHATRGELFGNQLLAVVTVIGWTIFWIGGLFCTLRLLGIIRVSAEHEMEGLDVVEHGGQAVDYASISFGKDSTLQANPTLRSKIIKRVSVLGRKMEMDIKSASTPSTDDDEQLGMQHGTQLEMENVGGSHGGGGGGRHKRLGSSSTSKDIGYRRGGPYTHQHRAAGGGGGGLETTDERERLQ